MAPYDAVILAADPVITGTMAAISTVVVAFLGWLGTRRSKRVDEAAQLIAGYKRWADQLRDSEAQCRAELAGVRVEIAALRDAVEKLQAPGG